MVKVSQIVVSPLLLSSAFAFNSSPRLSSKFGLSRSSSLRLSEEVAEPIAAPPAPEEPADVGGKLVPIKEETIEFTAGLLGGVAGFALGGPLLGALGAAAANYASKKDAEVGEITTAISKASIEVYNYVVKLDTKYEALAAAQSSLESTLEKLKSSDSVNPETVSKVEEALAGITGKINDINEEYDLVGLGLTSLGVVGDLIEKAVMKASELNEEYKITDKGLEALKGAIDKASAAAKSASG